MELKKNRFKKEEVELLINKVNLHYNNKLSECYALINELKEENRKLSSEVEKYKNDNEIISSSIIEAKKKSKEVMGLADKKYNLEILELTQFHEKWTGYFNYLFQKYPLYPEIEEMKKLSNEIATILVTHNDSKKKVEKIDRLISNKKVPFNPKKKIENYVLATSDNGFNLDEVLNPGELKLEDLCKELGLIDE